MGDMKPNYYVDNKKLYTEMVKYVNEYKECKEKGIQTPRCPEYIGECVWKIANGLSITRNFVGYTFRDDMIGDGVENTIRYLHNFDPDKTNNPFAYFTQIIYYAFLRRIEKEKKQTYIKYKVTEDSIAMNTLVEMSSDDASQFAAYVHTLDYEKLAAMSDKFEKKQRAKSSKKKGLENFIGDDDANGTEI